MIYGLPGGMARDICINNAARCFAP